MFADYGLRILNGRKRRLEKNIFSKNALCEQFFKRSFVYILTIIKTLKKRCYKNTYSETYIKGIKSVWLPFILPVIDKEWWSSPGTTPKFILPLPVGTAEINFTPAPLHAVVWGFAIKSRIH